MSREISRRVTLAWVAAASALPGVARAQPDNGPAAWSDMAIAPLAGNGYGPDPDLQHPAVTWPLTLDPHQRETLRIAADLMLPADQHSPSGGSVGLDAFIDEWISAPYPEQQRDRALILKGLAWLDAECQRRFAANFTQSRDEQRRELFDLIAYRGKVPPGYQRAAQFFARLRGLMMMGFYTLPEGMADIGYMGNQPVLGPYPGPTPEAAAHLNAALVRMGLKPVA